MGPVSPVVYNFVFNPGENDPGELNQSCNLRFLNTVKTNIQVFIAIQMTFFCGVLFIVKNNRKKVIK